MNIINQKIKLLFKRESKHHKNLGLSTNTAVVKSSISKKIEDIEKYIKPLRLKLVLIDSDLNLEKLEVDYSMDMSLNEIVKELRELMIKVDLKKIELDYKGQKITLE